jgi:hypothetical protein
MTGRDLAAACRAALPHSSVPSYESSPNWYDSVALQLTKEHKFSRGDFARGYETGYGAGFQAGVAYAPKIQPGAQP